MEGPFWPPIPWVAEPLWRADQQVAQTFAPQRGLSLRNHSFWANLKPADFRKLDNARAKGQPGCGAGSRPVWKRHHPHHIPERHGCVALRRQPCLWMPVHMLAVTQSCRAPVCWPWFGIVRRLSPVSLPERNCASVTCIARFASGAEQRLANPAVWRQSGRQQPKGVSRSQTGRKPRKAAFDTGCRRVLG